MEMEMTEWTYLNDGLYAKYDGYQIVLRANDVNNPEDTVYLDYVSYLELTRFASRSDVFNMTLDAANRDRFGGVPEYTLYGNCSMCGLPIADDEDVHDDYEGLDCHAACCPVCKDEVLLNG